MTVQGDERQFIYQGQDGVYHLAPNTPPPEAIHPIGMAQALASVSSSVCYGTMRGITSH